MKQQRRRQDSAAVRYNLPTMNVLILIVLVIGVVLAASAFAKGGCGM